MHKRTGMRKEDGSLLGSSLLLAKDMVTSVAGKLDLKDGIHASCLVDRCADCCWWSRY
jgi:hypothetical protein